MTTSIIYQQNDLTIRVSESIEPGAVKLLQGAVYGTTGVRYRQTGQASKLAALAHPHFFYLYRGGQLIGMYCLDERAVALSPALPVTGFYGRYLVVAKEYNGMGYGGLLKRQAILYIQIRQQQNKTPYLLYSYIEENNTRSTQISTRTGFKSVAKLKTFFYRRWNPIADNRLQQADSDTLSELIPLLNGAYKGYGLKTFARIGYQQQYYVIRDQGRIVAGVQANPVRWHFHQVTILGRRMGSWFIQFVSRVPFLNRLLNLKNYQFLALEGLYIQPGHEELLPVLLDSVLQQTGFYTAMLLLDERDPIVDRLTEITTWFSGFKDDVCTHVMVKAVGIPDTVLNRLPVSVSSFDFT